MSFSLAILLSKEHFPLREMFVTTTIVIVLFTVFFQVGGDSSGPNISVREGWRSGESPHLPPIAGGAGGAPASPHPKQKFGGNAALPRFGAKNIAMQYTKLV